MFFDRFARLCKENGISMNKAITDCGFSNSLPTKWKKTGATPDISTIAVLAPYFGKSVEYMTGMALEAQIDDARHELSILKDRQKSTVDPQERFDLDVDICALQDSLDALLSRFKNEQKNKPVQTDEQNLSEFEYAAHQYDGDLTEEDKATLIGLMKKFAAANKMGGENGATD